MNIVETLDKFPMSIDEKIRYIDVNYPILLQTGETLLFSTLRRMKVEEEFEIPFEDRYICEILTEDDKKYNIIGKYEWEDLYEKLSDELKQKYPELWESLFGV